MHSTIRWWLVAVLTLPALTVFAQSADSTHQAVIGTFKNPILLSVGDSVKNHENQVVCITGPIVSTNKWQGKDGVVGYLDMFRKWPDNPLSITIYRDQMPFFEPIEQYNGKTLRLTGKVNKYKDKKTGKDRYSIVLRKPDQLEVLD